MSIILESLHNSSKQNDWEDGNIEGLKKIRSEGLLNGVATIMHINPRSAEHGDINSLIKDIKRLESERELRIFRIITRQNKSLQETENLPKTIENSFEKDCVEGLKKERSVLPNVGTTIMYINPRLNALSDQKVLEDESVEGLKKERSVSSDGAVTLLHILPRSAEYGNIDSLNANVKRLQKEKELVKMRAIIHQKRQEWQQFRHAQHLAVSRLPTIPE